MKIHLFLTIIFIPLLTYTQSVSILDKFSFKSSYTFSLTQRGISPFSKTRPFRRGISSVAFNLQIEQTISKNAHLCIGIQTVERGFKHVYNYQSRIETLHSTYEHRLQYLELPITYIYHYKKWGIITGITPSYLYHSDHRTYYDLIRYTTSGVMTSYFESWMARPHADGRFKTWDIGGVLGFSRKIYGGIEVECIAQKQFIFTDAIFPHNRDIAYFITLSAGIRYKFLSNKY